MKTFTSHLEVVATPKSNQSLRRSADMTADNRAAVSLKKDKEILKEGQELLSKLQNIIKDKVIKNQNPESTPTKD